MRDKGYMEGAKAMRACEIDPSPKIMTLIWMGWLPDGTLETVSVHADDFEK